MRASLSRSVIGPAGERCGGSLPTLRCLPTAHQLLDAVSGR